MALYQYVKQGGSLGQIEATSPDEAIKIAPDIDPKSGVAVIQAPQTPQEKTPAQLEAERLREREQLSSGITSDSGTLRDDERRLGLKITDGSIRPPLDLSYITQQEEALAKRREEATAQIEREYAAARGALGETQKREVGSTSATIARAGGYLGESASALGVLTNLAATHRAEMSSLEAKRQAALQAARNAYDDKSFELAKLKFDEAKAYEQESYKRQQDFFDNTIRQLAEERAQAGEERTKQNQVRDDARSAFNTLISSYTSDYFENLTPEDKTKFLSQARELGVQAGYPEAAIDGLLAQSKAEQSKRLQLVQDAAKRGAPESILSGIATAATFAEAASLAGPYLQKSAVTSQFGEQIEIPEFEQFVREFAETEQGLSIISAIEEEKRMNLNPLARIAALSERADIQKIYEDAVKNIRKQQTQYTYTPFTNTEKKKLEQAGLVGATRQEQLDYLYGGDSVTNKIESMFGG